MTLDRPRTETIAAARRGPRAEPALPPHLEDRLREAAPHAGRHVGDARGFGMEDRGAQADEGDRDQEEAESPGQGQGGEPGQREQHPEGQRIGLGPAIGDRSHDGLEERGGELVREGDETYLGEAQVKAFLDEGIDRRDDGLHGIVEQVREADRNQYREDSRPGGAGRRGLLRRTHAFPKKASMTAGSASSSALRPSLNSVPCERTSPESAMRNA